VPDASDYYQLIAALKTMDSRVEGLATMALFEQAANLIQPLLECESPIEQLMYCALAMLQKRLGSFMPLKVKPQHWLRDLYRRRNIELAIFNELTDKALIDASILRIKAVDEQIRAARTALEHDAERLRHEARTSVERVRNERRTSLERAVS